MQPTSPALGFRQKRGRQCHQAISTRCSDRAPLLFPTPNPTVDREVFDSVPFTVSLHFRVERVLQHQVPTIHISEPVHSPRLDPGIAVRNRYQSNITRKYPSRFLYSSHRHIFGGTPFIKSSPSLTAIRTSL